jgi:hypothetical protein
VESVRTSLEARNLRGQGLVVEQQSAVRQPHGHLRRVLHLDKQVDGAVEVRQHDLGGLGVIGEGGGAHQAASHVDSILRSFDQKHVALRDDVVGVRVEVPLATPARRDHPHSYLDRESELSQASAHGRRLFSDLDAGHGLVGVTQVAPEVVHDTETRGDDAGDVLGGVGDVFDGGGNLEYARHVLGVLGASGGKDAHLAQVPEMAEHALFEAAHLLGEIHVGEEHGRVGQVHHQLRRVLDLGEESLDRTSAFSGIHCGCIPPDPSGYSEDHQ